MKDDHSKSSFRVSLIAYLTALAAVLVYRFILPVPADSPYYLGVIRLLSLVSTLTIAFYIFAFRFDRLKALVYDYFTAVSHPLILAIFRISFFAFLLEKQFYIDQALVYSRSSKELMVLPFGTGWLSGIIPINEPWMGMAVILFKVFCWMGLLGIATRFSTLMTAVLFYYIGGVPQLFGKVNHYHNLLWFNAILAVSPCADYLSVDAAVKACRRADEGSITPPQPSRAHGLPIRFIWLLYGLAYFWAGFWKLWVDGKGWISGTSLRDHLYSRWMDFPGWMPAFRIDKYPILCKLGGISTIVVEMGFIFLLFSPLWRWFAVGSGFIFHMLNEYFMKIYFAQMRTFYFIFFPLDRILHQVGRWMFPKDMTVFFDGNCQLCRRTVAVLRVFDIFERIAYVNALDPQSRPQLAAAGITEEAALKDMHAVCERKVYKGYNAYRSLVFRMPVLWPVLPFLFLWPVTAIGKSIYRTIADSRKCTIALKRGDSAVLPQQPSWALISVGSILIAANSFCGALKIDKGWPFACYPTFSHKQWMVHGMLEFEIMDQEGKVLKLQSEDYLERFDRARFKALISEILYKEPELREKRLEALWLTMVKEWPELSSVRAVKFFEVRESKIPEEKHLNPISREMIYELRFK